ncbi:MAG: efflux RND transporter periplasmic adaptor subunit [Desulfococcaceae bacterium]
MQKDHDSKEDIRSTLGLDVPKKKRRTFLILLAAAVLLLIGGFLWFRPAQETDYQFKTAEVKSGELVVTVTATGSLEPVNQVEVGTEVSGTVKTVAADYNDRVSAGQVLAELDTEKLSAQMLQSQAALASAQANYLEAQARVLETDSSFKRLAKSWKISGGKVPSRQELDAAEATLKYAQAGEAAAKAKIDQTQADLDAKNSDLAKAIIRSPISGIVLSRSVEPGQTVAASLQTPVLFTLAEDLAKMELHVNVDEADIGQVQEGQSAMFTVDAYSDRHFPARIIQTRYAPVTENNVVTYETLLAVDNSELLLRPGMTASAEITVQTIKDALLIPNAALRFTPPDTIKKTGADTKKSRGFIGSLMPGPPGRSSREKQTDADKAEKKSLIWILENGHPKSVTVETGATDGTFTEIKGNGIKTGMKVLTDTVTAKDKK